MKKIILAALVSLSSLQIFAADPHVDEKVLTAFHKTFQYAEQVNWMEFPESYQVSFHQSQMMLTVTYDKQGTILKTLRYYGEENLPVLVLNKLRSRFPEKKVFGVVEESSEEGTFYHVTLEDQAHWLKVKSDIYGAVTVEKKFKKA